MNALEYFKDKGIFIAINLIVLFFTSMILRALRVDTYAVIFTVILNFLASLSYYIYDYYNKKKYYDKLYNTLEALDKKYLISQIVTEGDFLEGKILYEILTQTDKSMNDEIARFINDKQEYKEYIELWVHEVKTPIAATKLLIENNKSKVTQSILEEVEKLENYIEQALFYSRSSEVEKDYIIKKLRLKDSISSVIIRNSNALIEKGIKVNIDSCDWEVYCDKKWLEFILHQVIGNSIKYINKEKGSLKLTCEEMGQDLILHIIDNGVGMNEKALEKAFDKGFTGDNGRVFKESTGIGLYLCKKLCIRLGLSISIKSKENQGTQVSLLFPKNNMYTFE